MAETSAATDALIDYLDALLTEEPAAAPGPAAQEAPLRIVCFTVAGLPLAVAAEEDAEVRHTRSRALPEHPVMAEIAYRGRVLVLLDTPRLILPRDHPALAAGSQGGAILILPRNGLALRCDHAGEIENVGQGEVAWRKRGGSRPWLAGRVRDRMLLDPAALLESARSH